MNILRGIGWLLLLLIACRADGGDGTVKVESAGVEGTAGQSPPAPPPPGGSPPASAAADAQPAKKEAAAAPAKGESEPPYYGSLELNPDQRPLKIDIRGKSKAEIDEILSVADPDIFMSKDEAVAFKKAQAEAGKKKDGTAGDKKKVADGEKKPEGKDTPPDPNAKVIDEETATKEFFEKTKLDQETFASLPEATQEALVDLVCGATPGQSEQLTKLEQEHQSFKRDTEVILNDPVIAARMEELQTGKNFVARDLPPVTDAEVNQIDDLLTKDKTAEARLLITKMIQDRAAAAVARERTVGDQRAAEKEMRQGVWKVFQDIGKLDPRFDLKETDGEKVKVGHKEWAKFEQGGVFADLKEYLRNRGLGMQSIVNAGAKEIYAAYAAYKGWDKAKEGKLVEFGRKEYLKALRNPKVAARTLPPGKADRQPGAPNAELGFDRKTLIDSLVKGNGTTPEYQRLLAANDGNDAALEQITSCFYEAQRIRQSQSQSRK